MKKHLLLGLTVTVLVCNSAVAADLPVYAPVPPGYAPVLPARAYFSWTGCYLGGNAGGLRDSKDWIDQIPGDPFFGTDFGTHIVSGALGGLQVGCNYQIGGFVIGLQGDYDWTDASGNNANLIFPALTDQSQIRSVASATARIGYAWDCFLGYVKAGGASERTNYSMLSGFIVSTASETHPGWTIGIGGEYAFLSWLTGFIEYDYYNFGTNINTFACRTCGEFISAAPVSITTNAVSVIKVGVNFKFGPAF